MPYIVGPSAQHLQTRWIGGDREHDIRPERRISHTLRARLQVRSEVRRVVLVIGLDTIVIGIDHFRKRRMRYRAVVALIKVLDYYLPVRR